MGTKRKNQPPEPTYKVDDPSHLEAAMSEVLNGDDRTTAILGGAMVDNVLEHTIKFKLAGDNGTIEELLKNELGTFSSRINMCFAMGIIGIITYRNLNLVREIRNSFAHQILMLSPVPGEGRKHELKPLSFKSRKVLSWCNSLQEITGWHVFRGDEIPKDKFIKICIIICRGLLGKVAAQNRTVFDTSLPNIDYHDTSEAELALAQALSDPSSITVEKFDELGDYMLLLPKDRLRDIAKEVRLKIAGTKKEELVNRLLDYLKTLKPPKEPIVIKPFLP